MGTSISSGNVSATIIGTTSDSALTLLSATRNSSGSTTMGTVPANKEWRIYLVALTTGALAADSSSGTILLNDIVFVGGSSQNVATGTTGMSSIVSLSNKYITLTAGQTVKLTTTNTITWYGSVGYQEVSV